MSIICLFVRLAVISKTINFPIGKFVKNVIFSVVIVTVFSFVPIWYLYKFLSDSFLSFMIVSIISVLLSLVVSLFVALSNSERGIVFKIILQKIRK